MTQDLPAAVEQLVLRRLIEDHGRTAVTLRPISSTIDVEVESPADYLTAVAAAAAISRVAQAVARNYANQARGEGRSWAEIATALDGSLMLDTQNSDDPGLDAFHWEAPTPSLRHDPITTSWRCTSCGSRVTDRGPYAGHPADNEEGHGQGCLRHAAEIRAHTAWMDDDGTSVEVAR